MIDTTIAHEVFDIEQWEVQYIEHWLGCVFPNYVNFADRQAIRQLPWVYDKFEVSKFNSNEAIVLPAKILYPKFVKPRTNLLGMGRNSFVVNNDEELKKIPADDYIAQEVYCGHHYSTDFLVYDGEILFSSTFQGLLEDGSFWLWKSINFVSNKSIEIINAIIKEYKYGFVNIETIDDNVIEVHLRPSLQFYDICGNLIDGGLKKLLLGDEDAFFFEETYSRVYRLKYDAVLSLKKDIDLNGFYGVKSIQYCWQKDRRLSSYAQDSNSYRYLIINGYDLDEIERCGELIKSNIRIKKLKKS